MHFFLFNVVVGFIILVILIVEVRSRGVVTEAFVMACAFIVVAIRVLEVDPATGNHSDFFWNGEDR